MPLFQYTARTLKGDLVNDKIDLPTRDDVIAHLRKNRMVVVQVRAAPKEFKLNFKFGGGVKTRDVVVFTRQFATMINAGLPLVQALDILAQQTENKILADVTRQVVYDVESGQTLADALRKHPKAFSDLFVLRSYYQTAPGRLQIDTLLLKTPVLGDVLRKAAVSRFTRTLGTLISSGVSILDGLEITARTAGNMVIHNAVMESRASIAGGETIAGPLQKSKVFPPMVISMIAVGEQTGGLDEMLSKIADFYDDEVDAAVSALLALMEPVMIVVLGVIVGGMVIAMYLPIFDMVNAVQ